MKRRILIGVMLIFVFMSVESLSTPLILRKINIQPKEEKTQENNMPKWLLEHMTFLTSDGGYWVTGNKAFESKDEPFDEYTLKWKWGREKKSIFGQMFSMRNGKKMANPWKIRVFWLPKEQRAAVTQVGADGTVGVGEIRNVEGIDKTLREVDAVFYGPSGISFRVLHKVTENKDEYTGAAFVLSNGSWKAQRAYTWRRMPEGGKE